MPDSMFLTIGEDSKLIRVITPIAHQFAGKWGTRYARLVIDRSDNSIKVWAYSYPIGKQLPPDVTDRDLEVWAVGQGRGTDYKVLPVAPSMLTRDDQHLISQCKIRLEKVCK